MLIRGRFDRDSALQRLLYSLRWDSIYNHALICAKFICFHFVQREEKRGIAVTRIA